MASHLIRASRRSLVNSIILSKSLTHQLQSPLLLHALHPESQKIGFQTRTQISEAKAQSPFDANIVRILRNEIDYQSEVAPPDQPVSSFKSFIVEEHPGQEWIRLRGNFGDREEIKIEATMFNWCQSIPKSGDDTDGENLRLHMNLIVDVSKGEGSDTLEFVCSAWPDSVDIHKVYLVPPKGLRPRTHMGPDFRDLDAKLQKAFQDYLEERGVDEELSAFLHGYVMNKDRTEFIRWLRNLKSFMQSRFQTCVSCFV